MHAAVHQTDKQTLTLVVTSFARSFFPQKSLAKTCDANAGFIAASFQQGLWPLPLSLGICEGGGEVTEMHQISGKGEENEEDGLIT